MKLPVRQILEKRKYKIVDKENVEIVSDIERLCDAMIIADTLNNYPKAIELLNRIYEDNKSYINDDGPSLELEIKEFLKQIEI